MSKFWRSRAHKFRHYLVGVEILKCCYFTHENIILSTLTNSLKKDSDRLHSIPRLYRCLKSDVFIPHSDTTNMGQVKARKRRYGQTWWLEILQKFRRYGKMKGTIRGSNLAKERVDKLYMDPTGIGTFIYCRRIMVIQAQKLRNRRDNQCRGVLPGEISSPRD